MSRPSDVKASTLKKGEFATHFWDRGGPLLGRGDRYHGVRELAAAPLCKTVKASGPILFAMKPTCRRCRFYRLLPKLGREGALAKMAEEDTAATPHYLKERT